MIFEDEFMDKQSEIINLYCNEINENVEMIYVYIFNANESKTGVTGFKVDNKIVYAKEAGIATEKDMDICFTIMDEILPELNDICKKYNKPSPIELKLIYNVKENTLDCDYSYDIKLEEGQTLDEYGYSDAGTNWVKSFENK